MELRGGGKGVCRAQGSSRTAFKKHAAGVGGLTKLERKPSVAENNESIPFTASVSASRLQAQKSCLKSPGAAGTSDREG